MAQQYDVRMPGESLERNTFVVRKARNKVHVPPELEGAKENHVYADVIDENGNPGRAYVAVPYDRTKHDYPKMFFHPDYHKEPVPNRNHFKETHEWEAAMRAWELAFDRTQMAQNEEEETEILAAGWLDKPPVFETSAQFDKRSLELYPGGKKPEKLKK